MLLHDQDRRLYEAAEVDAGRRILDLALALRGRGPYVVQAAIASLHADAQPDWHEIEALYTELARLTRSPVVELNRAVAVAETEGADAALQLVEALELHDYRYFHSTRGELLRRLDRHTEAHLAFARAIELTPNGPERRFLEGRLAETAP